MRSILTACWDCGCARAAHDHYRIGTDCGRCGPDQCPRYVPVWRRPLSALALALWLARVGVRLLTDT